MRIFETLKKATQDNKASVAYRAPNENTLQAVIQKDAAVNVFDDFSKTGFVFAPFDNKEDAYLIHPDEVLEEQLKEYRTSSLFKTSTDLEFDLEVKRNHVERVAKAIEEIQNSELTKIVISRKESVETDDFDTLEVFENLLYAYPNAYVYLWSHPNIGTWLGATPETLLTVEGKRFKTMSLAGTQPYKNTLQPVWGAKELEEQQMVSDFIEGHLKNNVDNLVFSEVETVKAGSLLHLNTRIKGELKKVEDVEKLVSLLHPTPAVCGLPREKSKEYILANEGYHRSFYTGYLGALNMNAKTALYVNLRCFSVHNNVVSLYVGGGITQNSNPELEWLETVAKSKTIKKVLA